jgi:nucleoside-diphosphate-sugar epimerase
MKKILITGSLGYIGSVLTTYLKENGYDCYGYDIGYFRECNLGETDDSNTIVDDVQNCSEKNIRKMDVVIHLAGISNDPLGNLTPEKVYDPTREYTKKIAKLCKKNNIKFIFPSSCSVYGIGNNNMLNENSQTNPQTPYSLNKIEIENDLKQMSDNDFHPTMLRLATVFGISPRIRFDIVINMLVGMAFTTKKIILNSDGMSWRPNVHISDVCNAFRSAIENEKMNEPLVLNIGSNRSNFRIIDLANLIKNNIEGCTINFLKSNPELDKSELIRDRKINDGVDKRTYKVDFTKVEVDYKQFKCKISVEDGIKNIVEYFKKINLTENQFKNKKFYRLQKLEELYEGKKINDELKWI